MHHSLKKTQLVFAFSYASGRVYGYLENFKGQYWAVGIYQFGIWWFEIESIWKKSEATQIDYLAKNDSFLSLIL